MTDGKFDRVVRMSMQYRKEKFERRNLSFNEDYVQLKKDREAPKKLLLKKLEQTVYFDTKTPQVGNRDLQIRTCAPEKKNT